MFSVKSTLLVIPSMVYGLLVWVRNKLYDLHVLKSTKFSVPIICVGNLSVGGNGKTPMAEYLLHLFASTHTVGVLSRGYGRSTKGFLTVTAESEVSQVGDEPLQIKLKFPFASVAVCENRVTGVKEMLAKNEKLDLIILDDGFQHRRLKADTYLLLSEYSHPFHRDFLMPLGRLREPVRNYKRANAIVFTKSPENHLPLIETEESIPVFYSSVQYEKPQISGEVVGFSGLANNKPFEDFLRSNYKLKAFQGFRDHHDYSLKDIKKLEEMANGSVLVCTEKDIVKLKALKLDKQLIVIGIKQHFDTDSFDKWIQKRVQR